MYLTDDGSEFLMFTIKNILRYSRPHHDYKKKNIIMDSNWIKNGAVYK